MTLGELIRYTEEAGIPLDTPILKSENECPDIPGFQCEVDYKMLYLDKANFYNVEDSKRWPRVPVKCLIVV